MAILPISAIDANGTELLINSLSAAIDGIIPGHLKLLIKSGDGGLILSMPRSDNIDKTCFGRRIF